LTVQRWTPILSPACERRETTSTGRSWCHCRLLSLSAPDAVEVETSHPSSLPKPPSLWATADLPQLHCRIPKLEGTERIAEKPPSLWATADLPQLHCRIPKLEGTERIAEKPPSLWATADLPQLHCRIPKLEGTERIADARSVSPGGAHCRETSSPTVTCAELDCRRHLSCSAVPKNSTTPLPGHQPDAADGDGFNRATALRSVS
jgi:hypothetical protein